MQAEGISAAVQVQNVPGAGGTVGLAQFASSAAGDPSQLIVGGYVMVGAILTNASPVIAGRRDPDCPPDRRGGGHRRFGLLADPEHQRTGRDDEGRSGLGLLGGRLGGWG